MNLRRSSLACVALFLIQSAACSATGPDAESGESAVVNGPRETGYAPAGYLLEAPPGTTTFGKPVCSAVLIAPKVAVTAGHCPYTDGHVYAFGVGEASARRFVVATDVFVHPDFDGAPFRHDLAVLTLASELPGVTPAVPTAVEELPNACSLHLVGYGVSRSVPHAQAEPLKGERRGADLCVTSSDGANLFFKPKNPAKGIPCFGDSGGPLMITGTNKVVGIQNNVFWANPANFDKGCFAEDEQGGIRFDQEKRFLACAVDAQRRSGGAFPDTGCSWSDPFLRAMAPFAVVKGDVDGSFHPGRDLKRSELATMIAKAFRLTAQPGATPFKDVPATHWAAASINAANAAHFLNGYPDGTFHPDSPVTHVELVVALASGLGLPALTPAQETAMIDKLSDKNDVPKWARSKVAAAIAKKMVVTEPAIGYFESSEDSSRGYAIATIYQAMLAKGLATQQVASDYVVKP